MGTGSFPRVKRPGRGLDHLPPPSAEVKERVELYLYSPFGPSLLARGQLKCDGTSAETIFCLSAKRTSPFKSAGASVQSTAGSRGVRISCSNAGYTTFRGSVTSIGYPLLSPVSPSLPLPCVTACQYILTGVYLYLYWKLKEAIDRILWRTRFGRGYGTVVRQTIE